MRGYTHTSQSLLIVLAIVATIAAPVPAKVIQSSYAGADPFGDRGRAVAVNPVSGDVYLVGETSSPNFPGAEHGPAGAVDAFIARFSGDLLTLKRSVLYGGSDGTFTGEGPCAVAIDPASGDVVMAGTSLSTDLVGTTGGFQSTHRGLTDVFVVRFDAALNVQHATYLGGEAVDRCSDVLIEPNSGDVLVIGAGSTTFPTTPGAIKTVSSFGDIFIARLSSDLSTLRRSTFLGGNNLDQAGRFAINPVTSDLVVVGSSSSTDFPVGARSATGFTARLDLELTELRQVTRHGGYGIGVAFNSSSGDIYVVGYEDLNRLGGTTGGAQPMPGGAGDAFALRLAADGTLIQATYIGGSSNDRGNAVIVDPPSGDVIVWGDTVSSDLPGTATGFQPMHRGGSLDGYLVRLNPELTMVTQATYVGGSGAEEAYGMVRDSTSGDIYVSGISGGNNFPGISGGADTVGGASDGVVSRLTIDLGPGDAGPTPTLTDTPIRSPSATPTPTATPSATVGLPSPTASSIASATPTAIATIPAEPCIGDCDRTGGVTVDEILTAVNIALGNAAASNCATGDGNGDNIITVDEILSAVNNALRGCPTAASGNL